MGDSKMASPVADVVDDHGANIIRVQNADELRLAQMGRSLIILRDIMVDGFSNLRVHPRLHPAMLSGYLPG
ncbi:hypothetical protein ACP6JB_004672 [Aspergillus fumigatus]